MNERILGVIVTPSENTARPVAVAFQNPYPFLCGKWLMRNAGQTVFGALVSEWLTPASGKLVPSAQVDGDQIA